VAHVTFTPRTAAPWPTALSLSVLLTQVISFELRITVNILSPAATAPTFDVTNLEQGGAPSR